MNDTQLLSQIQCEEKINIQNSQLDHMNSFKKDNSANNQSRNVSLQLDFSIGLLSPSNKLLKQQDWNNLSEDVVQRNVQKEENEEKQEIKKELSPSNIHVDIKTPKSQINNSQKPSSSRNSLDSANNLSNDQKFLQSLLKRDDKMKGKWYYYLVVLLRFLLIQFFFPVFMICITFKKKKQEKKIKKTRQQTYLFLILKIYFCISSVFLWMAIVNFIYLKYSITMDKNDYEELKSEYNKILMYYFVAGVGFTILNTTLFKNSSFFFKMYKSLQSQTSTNIPKCMKALFISESDFVFQFFTHQLEDENKIKERQKVKKVFNIDQNSPFFQECNFQQYYSGLDFCQKIVHYSEKLNVDKKQFFFRQFIFSFIAYLKAFIPGIYRQVTEGKFEIYNSYMTVIPYLCIGNILGYFARSLNSLQDLNFIYDYNRALCALISYEPYLKLKPKYKINTPCINLIDARSIKTWTQMRRLLNEIKQKETIPIDQCTLFLFVYLILVFLSVFLDKFYNFAIFFSISSDKYLILYYTVDVVIIFILFSSRVFKQTQINYLYKEQFKLLQNMKNILLKFFTFRQYFNDREDITFLDKDIQWYFYKEINTNYEATKEKIKTIFDQFNYKQNNQNLFPKISQFPLSQSDQDDDFEYQQKLFSLIEFIQEEIHMEILQTPMKFMGLMPSSYGLLSAFFTIVAMTLYLAFYLFFYL